METGLPAGSHRLLHAKSEILPFWSKIAAIPDAPTMLPVDAASKHAHLEKENKGSWVG
jgi:hypothetical protein